MLKVGEPAPDFTLTDQKGRRVSLSGFVGTSNVVLYFYPKDFTPGCTSEAKGFSSNYADFKGMGAEVLGVSSDTVESHMSFGEECDVPFPLLSDPGGKVRSQYGVSSSLGIIPGRVTFVIDAKGIVRYTFSSQLNPGKHIKEALSALRQISN
jgi:peroxiredoxin Q/BCP